jgi:hypothetical protein
MDTYSEEFRHQCEVRTVLAWPASQRKAFIELVAKKRGPEAAQQLHNAVYRAWVRKQADEIAKLDGPQRERRLTRIGEATNFRTRGDVEAAIAANDNKTADLFGALGA